MNLGKDKCMGNIKIDLKNARVFEKNIMKYADRVKEIHNSLLAISRLSENIYVYSNQIGPALQLSMTESLSPAYISFPQDSCGKILT